MDIEYLLTLVHNYSVEDKELIIRAYEFAKVCHKNVFRKSGEPYIIHPLSVACILAEMHADADTIAAGLLHDILEDCPQITKEYLASNFNPTIANLVDGVTKLKKIDFNNDKILTEEANIRKLIESSYSDIRVIIIKLADKLHNMRTEEYQPPHKQEEHSRETRDLFVPFARLTGAYKLMTELEDLSFFYLDPKGYQEMDDLINYVRNEYEEEKEQILIETAQMLNSNHVPYNIKTQIKSHYELHRKLLTYGSYQNIHDLYGINIILGTKEDCYSVRSELELMFKFLKDKRKDYIKRPKTNLYQALHTSIISPHGYNFQFQLSTAEMHKINSYGLTAYWDILKKQNKEEVAKRMQQTAMTFPVFSLISKLATDTKVSNQSYVDEIKNDVLKDKVYVSTPKGDIIELPSGATPVDFAYKIHSTIGNTITKAIVNGECVPLSYVLKSKDVVKIEYDPSLLDNPNFEDYTNLCTTAYAKRMIKEYHKSRQNKLG